MNFFIILVGIVDTAVAKDGVETFNRICIVPLGSIRIHSLRHKKRAPQRGRTPNQNSQHHNNTIERMIQMVPWWTVPIGVLIGCVISFVTAAICEIEIARMNAKFKREDDPQWD
jgi:hypothetical protein